MYNRMVVSIAAADALVLQHQAITSLNTDPLPNVPDQLIKTGYFRN